ncbi:MAG: family transcriptional regulator, regulator of embCAB operon [Blastocatellia bacterium]|nr:family transcriptional regulator, regulator of embCAB operon [Blastocatellia bacterium]
MPKARLIVSQPGQRTRSIEVKSRSISIGRRPDNTICLDGDTKVSKYHAVIENRDGEFWVTDLGSSNGTTVNDKNVPDQRKLKNRDMVGIGGSSTIEFQIDEQSSNGGSSSGIDSPNMPDLQMPDLRMPGLPAQPNIPNIPNVPNVPNIPNVNLPQVPSANINLPRPSVPQLPSAPVIDAPAAVTTYLGMRLPTLAFTGLIVVAAIAGTLYATGIIGGSSTKTEPPGGIVALSSPDPDTPSSANGTDVPPEVTSSVAPVSDGPVNNGSGDSVSQETVAALGRTLAVQISQKSFYNFDPAFASLISRYVDEYRNSGDYIQRATKYREAVDREFINAQGIQPPLIGYVLAMSQSKFIEKPGSGVWGLPPAVVKSYATGATPPNMSDPAASTKIAASYLRSLLDLFERDNFMYAVACYGMSLDQAGKVRTEMERKDPGGQDRFDFWKMKNAGVVQGDQVERVARFFAAGIVCENPRQFGLNQKQLSSLY